MVGDMKQAYRRMTAVLITGGLVFAGCGGDDDSDSSSEPVSQDDAGADDATDTGDDGSDAGADDDSGGDDSDLDGSGSNDEAQESFDDAGVDMDLDELEESIGGMGSGDGGGVVTIDGGEYPFEANGVCLAQGTDFVAEGLGQTPDGEPAWVSISMSNDDFDGDGDESQYIDVFVEVGKTELFGSGGDDQPDWSASYTDEFENPDMEIVAELNGSTASGNGPIQDYNAVAIPFGESVDMSFEASCG